MMNMIKILVLFAILLSLLLTACRADMLPSVVAPESVGEVAALNDSARQQPDAAVSLAQTGDNAHARLLAFAFAAWDPMQQEATLPKVLLGELPAHLPFTLGLPAETMLVGSITGEDERWGSVFLTTTLAPQVAMDSFKASLIEQGLVDMDQGLARTEVFMPSHNFPPGFAVCGQARNFVVWGSAMPFANGVTSIRLNIEQSGSGGPCQAMDPDANRGASWEPLPTLVAPAGVVVQEQGGSMGYHSLWTTTELESKLSIPDLAAIYNQQLLDAGWQQLEQGSQGHAAWSMWTFQDAASHAWTGSLYLFANPVSSTRYTAVLRADRQTE